MARLHAHKHCSISAGHRSRRSECASAIGPAGSAVLFRRHFAATRGATAAGIAHRHARGSRDSRAVARATDSVAPCPVQQDSIAKSYPINPMISLTGLSLLPRSCRVAHARSILVAPVSRGPSYISRITSAGDGGERTVLGGDYTVTTTTLRAIKALVGRPQERVNRVAILPELRYPDTHRN